MFVRHEAKGEPFLLYLVENWQWKLLTVLDDTFSFPCEILTVELDGPQIRLRRDNRRSSDFLYRRRSVNIQTLKFEWQARSGYLPFRSRNFPLTDRSAVEVEYPKRSIPIQTATKIDSMAL